MSQRRGKVIARSLFVASLLIALLGSQATAATADRVSRRPLAAAVIGAPAAPTHVTAVETQGYVTVNWTASASDGGSPIYAYTVTSSPNNVSIQSSPSPTFTVITGMPAGQNYTFTVTATNEAGIASAPSTPSNQVYLPLGLPTAPGRLIAFGGDGSGTVSWLPPDETGGAPISSYTVTASPGGRTATVAGSVTTATVSELTNGTSYTFTVTATTPAGTGPASVPSGPITPAVVLASSVIQVPSQEPTIQAAINAAEPGASVVVSPGTYHEDITFWGKPITVRAADGPADTTIDGGQSGPTVQFDCGETSSAVLQGFTITHGNSNVSSNYTLPACYLGGNPSYDGGGVLVWSSSPVITGDVITDNTASTGAGIFVCQGSPIIEYDEITNNDGEGGFGAGVAVECGPGATIVDNVFTGNYADEGDAIYYEAGGGTIEGNLISSNGFWPNGTWNTYADAVSIHSPAASLIQNVIVENQGTGLFWGASGSIVSNTVADNVRDQMNLLFPTSAMVLYNNVFSWDPGQVAPNESPNTVQCTMDNGSSTPTFVANDIGPIGGGSGVTSVCGSSWPPPGNLSVDPGFADPYGGSPSFQLASGSRLINAGNTSAPGLPATDFLGNPRVAGGAVDIGAYEWPDSSGTGTAPGSGGTATGGAGSGQSGSGSGASGGSSGGGGSTTGGVGGTGSAGNGASGGTGSGGSGLVPTNPSGSGAGATGTTGASGSGSSGGASTLPNPTNPAGAALEIVQADGSVETTGAAPHTASGWSTGSVWAPDRVAGIAVASGSGYRLATAMGRVLSYGGARSYGSAAALHLAKPIVGIVATPDGEGYWLVGADGGVLSYGDARFYGSAAALHLAKPIVGIVATPDGEGYWLVGADGGVLSFGDAPGRVADASTRLASPVAAACS
jgi:hypothetical protein